MPANSHRREQLLVALAFVLVYVLWGSTFLFIRVAVMSMPPFQVASWRFFAAGMILLVLELARRQPFPTWDEWLRGSVLGVVMFLIPYGALFWAEQHVPSGLAAVVLATIPMFTLALEIWPFRMARLNARVAVGMLLGLVGVTLLTLEHPTKSGRQLIGSVVLIAAAASWSFGTILARNMRLPRSKAMSSSVQMVTGGIFLCLLSLTSGELVRLHLSSIPLRAWISLVYLTLAGSVITFTAFVWLLARKPPSVVATYAYVNPVVAVVLGWLFLHERLSAVQVLASAIVIAATALVLSPAKKRASAKIATPEVAGDRAS